jgi:hypothetical protein
MRNSGNANVFWVRSAEREERPIVIRLSGITMTVLAVRVTRVDCGRARRLTFDLRVQVPYFLQAVLHLAWHQFELWQRAEKAIMEKENQKKKKKLKKKILSNTSASGLHHRPPLPIPGRRRANATPARREGTTHFP